MGFEPTSACYGASGFQDRPVRPLRHPAAEALCNRSGVTGLGVTLGLLPPEGHTLILAGAILSITLNPVLFSLVSRLKVAQPA